MVKEKAERYKEEMKGKYGEREGGAKLREEEVERIIEKSRKGRELEKEEIDSVHCS